MARGREGLARWSRTEETVTLARAGRGAAKSHWWAVRKQSGSADKEEKKGNVVASKEIYFKIGLCAHIYKTHKKLKKFPSDSRFKQKKENYLL